jgi:transposase
VLSCRNYLVYFVFFVFMPKNAPVVVLSENDRSVLQKVVAAYVSSQRMVFRCRIVLLAYEGLKNYEIAGILDSSCNTVGKWRSLYVKKGFGGLSDAPRPGTPPTYTEEDVIKIVSAACTTPIGYTHWSMRRLADFLEDDVGISYSQLYRILKDLDLKPHQCKSWLHPRDPEFKKSRT